MLFYCASVQYTGCTIRQVYMLQCASEVFYVEEVIKSSFYNSYQSSK